MAYSNTTPHYGLPQFVASDEPSWLTDVNEAMLAIDTQMNKNASSGGDAESSAGAALEAAQAAQAAANNAQSAAQSAVEQAAEAKSQASTAQTTAIQAQTQAQTAATAADNALSKADEAETRANTAISAASAAQTSAGTALSTANSALASAGEAHDLAADAVGDAANALSSAQAAQATANNANTDAGNAQLTANSVKSAFTSFKNTFLICEVHITQGTGANRTYYTGMTMKALSQGSGGYSANGCQIFGFTNGVQTLNVSIIGYSPTENMPAATSIPVRVSVSSGKRAVSQTITMHPYAANSHMVYGSLEEITTLTIENSTVGISLL